MIRILALLLLLIPVSAKAQSGPDTVRVYFGLNEDQLSAKQQARLDSLIYRNVLQPGQSLQLIGYCDYVGGEGENEALSRRRARHVLQSLTASGFSRDQIQSCIGKGEVRRPGMKDPAGYAPDRRVDIVTLTAPVPPPPAPVKAPPPAVSKVNLAAAKVNETFVLDNINFYPARHIPLESSLPALEQLYHQLNEHKHVRVSIEGHICCPESPSPADDAMDIDTHERNLSRNRAKYVYDYLVEKGIDSRRLAYKGFAFLHPVVPVEQTEEDQQKNRRVEIRITGR